MRAKLTSFVLVTTSGPVDCYHQIQMIHEEVFEETVFEGMM